VQLNHKIHALIDYMQLQYQQNAYMYIKNSYIHADLLQPCGHVQRGKIHRMIILNMCRLVMKPHWFELLCNHPVFHLPDDGHMVGRNMSEVTLYKTICKILVYIQPSCSPYPDAYQSTPLHPVCLRSILILYRSPLLGLPWGLYPFVSPTKTLRALLFCIVCAMCPTHQVYLNLICIWIDVAQDEDSFAGSCKRGDGLLCFIKSDRFFD
jgi:hypothetical protein